MSKRWVKDRLCEKLVDGRGTVGEREWAEEGEK